MAAVVQAGISTASAAAVADVEKDTASQSYKCSTVLADCLTD